MKAPASEHRQALRDIGTETCTSKRPWLARPEKIDFAMVLIACGVISPDGGRLEIITWSVGSTTKVAIRKWMNRRIELGLSVDDYKYKIVTAKAGKTHHVQPPLGPRDEPTVDTMTEYLAATA